jgi:hypothetical protein
MTIAVTRTARKRNLPECGHLPRYIYRGRSILGTFLVHFQCHNIALFHNLIAGHPHPSLRAGTRTLVAVTMARTVIDASTMLTGISIEVTFADAFLCDAHTSHIAVLLATWCVANVTGVEPMALALSINTITMTTAVPLTPLSGVKYLR